MTRFCHARLLLLIVCILARTQAYAIDTTPSATDTSAVKQKLLESIQVHRAGDQRPPNIVVILADDLGYADIGCYGSKEIPTPHIDSLARDGLRCTDGYVTAGTCSPSRAGLLSGCYQHRFGFEFNCNAATSRKDPATVGLDPNTPTIADVLKRAGYATGICGKWHVGFHEHHHPLARGFDEFFGFLPGAHQYLPAEARGTRIATDTEEGASSGIFRGTQSVAEPAYLTEAFARESVSFIERHAQQPFFLYVPFNAVHTPFQTTDKYSQRFSHIQDERRRVYDAMTSALDDAVGEILAALQKQSLEENTLVVFLSDNGGPTYTGVQSNGPLRLGKLFLFEGGVRVPFLVRWPAQLKGGRTYGEPISALDLLPTFAETAGARLPKELRLDGVSLLPYLCDEKTGAPHELLCWRNGTNHAVRKANWKLVQAGNKVWLFDLSKDIGEANNLANSLPEVVAELQKAFERWSKEMKPAAWPSRPGKAIEVDGVPYNIEI
ncbi:MAG: sulfatase [Pirellulaceae bacterium]|nr:sulfatase [Pirellulaceae bacterium]